MGMLEKATIFLGAFLLFLVQPMVGNTLLPVFGGTATVWSVCLAAFQILLVAGYWYAHVVGVRRTGTRALPVHCVLLFAGAAWIWIAARHRPEIAGLAEGMPSAAGVLTAVVALVAVPYIILSANSSLVQEISGGKYGLYAVSNLGSLLGLWAYPMAFERWLPLSGQWAAFSVLSIVYAAMFTWLVLAGRGAKNGGNGGVGTRRPTDGRDEALPSHGAGFRPIRYFALSALSCFLLNAVSTHLGSDITPLPLLWVALLSLYLLSYIIGFTKRGSQLAPLAGALLVPMAAYAAWHVGLAEFRHFKMEMVAGASVLFVGGLVVHSRLYAMRPDKEHLTRYYLMIALGGAFGGAVCSFLMPVVCDRVLEYPLAVAAVLGVALVLVYEAAAARWGRRALPERRNAIAFGAVVTLVVGLTGMARIGSADGKVLKRYRNFYGCGVVSHRTIKVSSGELYEANEFRCNGTTHGFQICTGRWAGNTPTVYYAAHAGGLPLVNHRKAKSGEPMRIGLCGMGIGTLAAYARAGDFYRFYEINSAVAELARDKALFSFLSDCKGEVEVVVDDARCALERERAADEPKYDVLVVDVFTGDAIPSHMATREAFALYLDRLASDGILAFHLSNWHLDLIPMIKAAALEFDLKAEAYYCSATPYAFESTWAFLSRENLPSMFDGRCHTKVDFSLVPDVDLMSDERHSLLPYIQWNVN